MRGSGGGGSIATRGVRGVRGLKAALGGASALARPEGRRAERLSRRVAAGAERALQRANRRELRSASGFTLLELLIVLAILTIGLAVSAPAFLSRRPSDVERLLDTLRAARTDAIRSGAPITWQHSAQRLVFLPDGSCSGGVVVVEGQQISVDPLTGAVRVTN